MIRTAVVTLTKREESHLISVRHAARVVSAPGQPSLPGRAHDGRTPRPRGDHSTRGSDKRGASEAGISGGK